MNNIPRVSPEEIVFCSDPACSGKRMMVRPEQKSASWMMDIMSKFSRPEKLVVDTCAGTMSTAKACLALPQHGRFVGCEEYSMCSVKSLLSLVKVHAEQVLNLEPDLVGSDKAVEAYRVFIGAMDAILTRRRVGRWIVPDSLAPVQTFPVHILHFSGYSHRDAALYDKCRNISPSQRTDM